MSTPRYLGTTAAEVRTVLQDVLTPEVYLREFDMDGDGEVAAASSDETALLAGVCAAERMVDVKLSASHGTPFTGAIPAVVRDIVAMLTPWCAMRYRNLAGDEKAPGRLLYNDAKELLKDLAADKQARIPETGAPSPVNTSPVVAEPSSFWGDPNGSCGFGGML